MADNASSAFALGGSTRVSSIFYNDRDDERCGGAAVRMIGIVCVILPMCSRGCMCMCYRNV